MTINFFLLVFPSLIPRYFKSYSQFGEDVLMRTFLHGQPIKYIDIGSGHPIEGSNTYFLYEAGFSGILIDPLQKNIDLSLKLRSKDVIIHGGVGSSAGTLNFFEFDPYQYSTFDESVAELRLSEGVPLIEKSRVPVFTFKSLNLKNEPGYFYFLCIDTEGFEMEVLKGIDFDEFKPEVIVIEDWERKSPDSLTDIYLYLSNLDYVWISRLKFSDVYVRRDLD